MRAYQFAKRSNFSVETCRRYGIHAQTARQVEQTYAQIMQLAAKQRLVERGEPGDEAEESIAPDTKSEPEEPSTEPAATNLQSDDALLKCIMAGFIDQLRIRRDKGTLEC